jgi:hypothetical protein
MLCEALNTHYQKALGQLPAENGNDKCSGQYFQNLTVNPFTRKNEGVLTVAFVVIFLGTWIDKGLGMIAGGFTPSPPEVVIALAVWATGFLILTALFKIAVGVKEEADS